MINLIEKLKEGFLEQFDIAPYHPPVSLRILKVKKFIRKELTEARDTGKVIGIHCPPIGEGMFLVGIDDILNIESEEIFVLKPYDMNGILLQRTHISMAEIRSVCPFDSFYINPMIKEPREATAA